MLERPVLSFTGGSFGYGRFLGAVSPKVGAGNLLTAFEWERDNGPWVSPNNKDKFNGLIRYSEGNARNGLSLTCLGFRNHWHSTDQIPQRAVDSGAIDRFGFIEETDGGETYRYAGIFDWQTSGTNDSTRLTAYTQRYYDKPGAAYRVLLADANCKACVQQGATMYPMAPAVVDDFGTLTIVGRWQ